MKEIEAQKIIERDLNIMIANKALPDSIEAVKVAIATLEEIQQYRAIGTVEEFKALKEKSEPKKGIPYSSVKNHKFVECPNCHKDMDLYYDFCQYCAQAVDWGKTKT